MPVPRDQTHTCLYNRLGCVNGLMTRAVCVAWEVHEQFGFRLNFGPGKCAVMISWRGKHSKLSRRALQDQDYKIRIENGDREVPLEGTDLYKHMGTQTADDDSLGQEFVSRNAGAWNKTRNLRKRLFPVGQERP